MNEPLAEACTTAMGKLIEAAQVLEAQEQGHPCVQRMVSQILMLWKHVRDLPIEIELET